VSCLGKILAGVVSCCLRRVLGFEVSFSHNGQQHKRTEYNHNCNISKYINPQSL